MRGKKTAQPKLPVVLVQEDNEDDTQTYFEVEELDDEDPQEEVNSDSVFFFCGACNMNFESLDDHVKKYHKNESIKVETEVAEAVPEESFVEISMQGSDEEHEIYEVSEIDVLEEKEEEEDEEEVKVIVEPRKLRNLPSTSTNKLPTVISMKKINQATQKLIKKRDEEEYDPEVASDEENTNAEQEINNGEETMIMVEEDSGDEFFPDDSDVYICTESGTFMCGICKTEFSTNKQLRLHTRIHLLSAKATRHKKEARSTLEEEPDWSLNCKLCNKIFKTKSNFNMHMKAHLSNNTTVQAPKGNMVLADRTKPIYPCQYCGKEFVRPHEKVKHERVHTGEKPYACETCGKCFRVSYCLTLHKRTHTDDRPYICPHCSKRFKAHSVYNHHLMTHSDVKNYKCPYCPKAFKTSVQLSGHKNSHTKPFACSTCSRKFATLYAVRGHMETHKNKDSNLKFSCAICGASYCREFALKDHVKANHPDAVYMIAQDEDDSKSAFIAEETESLFSTNDNEENYDVVVINDNERELMDIQEYCMEA